MSKLGFVYTLINSVDDEFYIGSTTTTLDARLKNHLRNFQLNKHSKLYAKTNEIGFDKFLIEGLECVPFDDKYDLYAREQFYMDKLKPSLNMRPAPDKKYNSYEKNKEAVLQSCEEYYQENRDRIIERVHKYTENNKDKIRKKNKKYREKHRDKIKAKKSEQIECECGLTYANNHRLRHMRTNRHNNLMESRQC